MKALAGDAEAHRALSEALRDSAVRDAETSRSELAQLREQHIATERELAAVKASAAAEMAALREQAAAQHETERKAREKQAEELRLQFKALATEIMGEQTRQMRTTSSEQIDLLLKPFRDNITDFRKRVEEIYTTQTEQGGALKAELKQLMELNRTISTDAQNLTSALKGNSKVQGDWGEMILDTILDSSNLVKGVHYFTQDTYHTEEGNVRPDVVLQLPEGKQIVIDSKTSLKAYTDYCSSNDIAHLDAHVASVRKHVAELAAKSYQELMTSSPDFVILFIPSEPALLSLLQRAPEIWAEAYRKKVVISSPTNLFALLKLVDNLWQRSDLERNTRNIAENGAKIYDKLVIFAEWLTAIEKGLNTAQTAYERAMRTFLGRGGLYSLGQKMSDLHVQTKRQFPQQILDAAESDMPLIGTVEQVENKDQEPE